MTLQPGESGFAPYRYEIFAGLDVDKTSMVVTTQLSPESTGKNSSCLSDRNTAKLSLTRSQLREIRPIRIASRMAFLRYGHPSELFRDLAISGAVG